MVDGSIWRLELVEKLISFPITKSCFNVIYSSDLSKNAKKEFHVSILNSQQTDNMINGNENKFDMIRLLNEAAKRTKLKPKTK